MSQSNETDAVKFNRITWMLSILSLAVLVDQVVDIFDNTFRPVLILLVVSLGGAAYLWVEKLPALPNQLQSQREHYYSLRVRLLVLLPPLLLLCLLYYVYRFDNELAEITMVADTDQVQHRQTVVVASDGTKDTHHPPSEMAMIGQLKFRKKEAFEWVEIEKLEVAIVDYSPALDVADIHLMTQTYYVSSESFEAIIEKPEIGSTTVATHAGRPRNAIFVIDDSKPHPISLYALLKKEGFYTLTVQLRVSYGRTTRQYDLGQYRLAVINEPHIIEQPVTPLPKDPQSEWVPPPDRVPSLPHESNE